MARVSFLGVFAERRNRVELRLARLLELDAASLVQPGEPEVGWPALRLDCLRKMSRSRTYCSRTVVRDFTNEKLAARDFIVIQWRTDFVYPDRWHVTQEAVDGELGVLWDEWITIGEYNYQNMGLWLQTANNLQEGLNRRLSLQGLMGVVTERTPDEVRARRHGPHSYMLARYPAKSLGVFASCFWGIDENDLTAMNLGPLSVWVDATSKDISKGEIFAYDGSRRTGSISQVFACFEEAIEVRPPAWLNGIPGEDGGFTVTDTKVAAVPHHR